MKFNAHTALSGSRFLSIPQAAQFSRPSRIAMFAADRLSFRSESMKKQKVRRFALVAIAKARSSLILT